MQVKIIQRVTDELVSNKIIYPEDREIYTYGLQQGALMLLNILTILFVGRMFGMLWQGVVFMVTYIPLRTYAGGYHARTQLGCYISSIVLIVAMLLVIKFIPWTTFIIIMISIISGLVIYILSPVEDSNKPLDSAEVKVYGKKARMILGFEFGVLILLIVFGENSVAECMSVSLFTLGVMLVMGEFSTRGRIAG
ncbi:MAG: accessory gene regulator B family protein [Sedimentibacter sp.]|uniref:accessory gene regulator ArgB-like protein n=1 Tax=Sedimentibacter sp. TaxID=1960295 RepID=UPI002981A9FA|nr:accessory gene regulator B family protein [Sedimentibacter sp.]MDW5300056.1 accessory gene regulator B family protein [Sedimentibacter sp.]